MRITRLTTENIKRISVVEITPAGHLITIGGKNGTGKSSVLDSIAYVLGGEKLVPTQPIRTGETEARIMVDLEDYIVTRRFYRERLTPDKGQEGWDPNVKAQFGPTKSVLTVTNREGAKYPSPQVLLDKLYGKLTFDPLAFAHEESKRQNAILRKLVNLDFSILDGQRLSAYERRAMHRKTQQLAYAKLTQMTRHAGAPLVETPIAEIAAEIKAGQALHQAAEAAMQTVSRLQQEGDRLVSDHSAAKTLVQSLERQLEDARREVSDLAAQIKSNETETDSASARARDARTQVPDFEALDKRFAEIDRTNREVRDNVAYVEQEAEVHRLVLLVDAETACIETIDAQKAAAMSSAQFPVEGLGLSDEGVTFEGLPLSEVSASVQLRVSIAIGLALNPTLKVLLIRNGNLLDEDSLKLVAAQAEEAGAQVWMEFVTSSKEGVSVMLEDGHVI